MRFMRSRGVLLLLFNGDIVWQMISTGVSSILGGCIKCKKVNDHGPGRSVDQVVYKDELKKSILTSWIVQGRQTKTMRNGPGCIY